MLSEEDDEALPYAYDVAASFAGSLSTTASKSPPVSRRTLSGSQQRPRQLARRGQQQPPPTPAPEDLAAKFDAHDMMAYYGTRLTSRRTSSRRGRLQLTVPSGAHLRESFLARSQPPMWAAGASFGDPITKGPSPPRPIPGAGLLGVPKQ